MSNSVPNMMEGMLHKIREMIDANTVVGTPVTTPDGTTIIPVSKVSIGFGGGGSDFATQKGGNPFGGGAGGGVKVTPVAFLVVTKQDVRLLNINQPAVASENIVGTISDFIDRSPDLVKRFMELFSKKEKQEKAE